MRALSREGREAPWCGPQRGSVPVPVGLPVQWRGEMGQRAHPPGRCEKGFNRAKKEMSVQCSLDIILALTFPAGLQTPQLRLP